MSYQSQSQLVLDPDFNARVQACTVQQANTFKDASEPDQAAVAEDCLRSVMPVIRSFVSMAAGGPGIADKVDNGDGTIDQSLATDADLLSLVQASWPTVASLYYNPDGTVK